MPPPYLAPPSGLAGKQLRLTFSENSDDHYKSSPKHQAEDGVLLHLLPHADDVLSNPYLLEHILTMVRMEDLLHFIRVSKSWCYLIAGSIRLQQKLFMAPKTHKSMIVVDDEDGQDYITWNIVLPPMSIQNTRVLDGQAVNPLFIDESEPWIEADKEQWKQEMKEDGFVYTEHGAEEDDEYDDNDYLAK
ncbi:Hypothetical protein D9617_25g060770 [Elsinoe fawcettii]|nr:Hypothetical protein D9617_25g060770 [Elsinoe fawcettii]